MYNKLLPSPFCKDQFCENINCFVGNETNLKIKFKKEKHYRTSPEIQFKELTEKQTEINLPQKVDNLEKYDKCFKKTEGQNIRRVSKFRRKNVEPFFCPWSFVM